MHKVTGECHCGNISYVAEMPKAPSTYKPRACDCNFCVSHGAEYISDKNGFLIFTIKNKSEINRYKQGSQILEFLICKKCGVLVGALYKDETNIYSSINIRPSRSAYEFGLTEEISPEQLNDKQRIELWKSFWFRNVQFKYGHA